MTMFASRTNLSSGLAVDLSHAKGHIREYESDAEIERMVRAATEDVEQAAQIAVLNQTINVTVLDTSIATPGLRLPIGPVSRGNIPSVTIDGRSHPFFQLIVGSRPYLHWLDLHYPDNPREISIEYTAGFGATADDVPQDVAQAIMDQAALHYDGRSPMDAKSLTSSPHMARVAAKYRGVQL
ncbi:head-tail connector protein [Pontibaca salina]|uniref:Uncharacterized protein n=1 Tax=Pontibaca salina TaxID=2795731 RepID=A0A934HUX9_9RHOB|nr:hypothetical protein [Pontibaca salina]MBI6630713.1 hypothetical protein [Pontibaca salina]